MSTEENKALIRRWYDLWIGREWESLYSLHADDFQDHNPGPGQEAGIQGVAQSLGTLIRAFPDCHIELTHLIAEGDLVVDHAVLTGTHKSEIYDIPASGKTVRVTATNIWRITDGKIAEIWHVQDVAGLIQQLGAMPNAMGVQPNRPAVRRSSAGSEPGAYATA